MAKTFDGYYTCHLARYLAEADKSKLLGPASVQRICGVGYNLARHIIDYGIKKGELIEDNKEHGFHRIALATSDAIDDDTHQSPNPIKLPPCTFCEGPPQPIVVYARYQCGQIAVADIPPKGLDAMAFVFCHECGARGEPVEDRLYDQDGIDRLEREAIELWCRRDNRHRDLYDAGDAEGLNLYPRPGEK